MLLRLRRQMLVAISVPGCWTQQTATKDPEPRLAQPVVISKHVVEPAIAVFDPASCAIDTLPETVCGAGDTDACGLDGSTIRVSSSDNKLFVTSWTEADRASRSFLPDDKATDEYRLRQPADQWLAYKCCFSRCTPMVVGTGNPQTVTSPSQYIASECIPASPKGTSMPDGGNPACAIGVKLGGELRPYSSGTSARCCYQVVQTRYNPGGRPARVDGKPELAGIATTTAWLADLTIDVDLAPALRDQLADAWLESARLEHASIAAFARLALQLVAHGAPPALVAAAHAAALDEIEHARLAFAIASAYAGRPLGPGLFPTATRMVATGDLAELALETFVDGCLGETVAALDADRAAAAARDPMIAEILARIAADETRHAELAWSIVAWCVRSEPMLLAHLHVALTSATSAPRPSDDDSLTPHGILGSATRHDALHE
ncbi:MAG: hypothetical protein ABI867_35695, partial [Kofleriaceae bacterium]